MPDPILIKSDEYWENLLSPLEYRVLREGETERPGSGEYNDKYESGVYFCAGCGNPLFSSEAKYDHGSGWPSFTGPIRVKAVEFSDDFKIGYKRTEVKCAICGGHLGHVFDDGPPPTGKHYCINSASLNFRPKDEFCEKGIFAAGCFWGVEHKFNSFEGVVSTMVGYTGGETSDPKYSEVCSGKTGHAEAVKVTYNPLEIDYETLVEFFFEIHDPTQIDRQGPDIGNQYRSAIYYYDERQKRIAETVKEKLEKKGQYTKIVTEIVPVSDFYKAEEYHQKYFGKIKNLTER